MATVSDYE